MKKLSQNLKNIFDGLVYQNASDYLNRWEKYHLLSKHDKSLSLNKQNLPPTILHFNNYKGSRHIALLCDGSADDHTINYIVDHGKNLTVDVLCHGRQQNLSYTGYQKTKEQLTSQQIKVELVNLLNSTYTDITNYLLNHPAIQCLVIEPNNQAVQDDVYVDLVKNKLNIPIVLIAG